VFLLTRRDEPRSNDPSADPQVAGPRGRLLCPDRR